MILNSTVVAYFNDNPTNVLEHAQQFRVSYVFRKEILFFNLFDWLLFGWRG